MALRTQQNHHQCLTSILFIWSLLLMLVTLPHASSAWMVKWMHLPTIDQTINTVGSGSIRPPRSGHVAIGLNGNVYVFGGYAEETSENRYPTNDLWVYNPQNENQYWQEVLEQSTSDSVPQQRLAAAAVTCLDPKRGGQEIGLLLGGWDSQEAGTGGVILQDLHVLSQDEEWQPLSFDLEQPTSRLCAVTLNSDARKVLVHNHRCTDHVMIVDLESSKLVKQTTKGDGPSPRGLHACAMLPTTNKMILFGGAAQDGNMSNEVFLLDTETWKWEKVTVKGNEQPSPRASPCFVALDARSCILFGGASRVLTGLHGCSDMWLLELSETGSEGQWTLIAEDGSSDCPPGRNAATLTSLPCKPAALAKEGEDSENVEAQYFILSGGWYPFRTTYNDNFVLQVSR